MATTPYTNYCKKLNKTMLDKALKEIDGHEYYGWAEDPRDDKYIFVLPDSCAAYRIYKGFMFVDMRDEPMSDGSMERICYKPMEEAVPIEPTGNVRKTQDKKTVVEFRFEDGSTMYIDEKYFKLIADVVVTYKAVSKFQPLYAYDHANEIIAMICPIRITE